jgi:hypothetical protein
MTKQSLTVGDCKQYTTTHNRRANYNYYPWNDYKNARRLPRPPVASSQRQKEDCIGFPYHSVSSMGHL